MVTRGVDEVEVLAPEPQRHLAKQEARKAWDDYGRNVREPYRALDNVPLRDKRDIEYGFIIRLIRNEVLELKPATRELLNATRELK